MENVVTFAHDIIKSYITKNSIVVDATVGNGYDTIFLAKHAKKVYGFDVQKEAIDATLKRCSEENIDHVTLILDTHENIQDYVHEKIDACIFNLGYRPNGDKNITTKAESSIKAINNTLPLLNKKGLITITIYVGHDQGKEEQEILEQYFISLDPSLYTVVRYQHINRPLAPYTVCIQKR